MRRLLLKGIARLTYHLPYTVVFFALLLTGVCIFWALRFKLQTDILELLPDKPAVREYRSVLRDFGSFEYGLAVLEARNSQQRELLIEAAQRLQESLDDPTFVFDIIYKTDEEAQNIYASAASVRDERLFFLLTESDWETIVNDRLTTEQIRSSMHRIRSRWLSVGVPVPLEELQREEDPLAEVIWSRMTHSLGPIKASVHRGYFLSDDERMLLMVLKPIKPSSNLYFTREYMRFLREARDHLFERHPEFKNRLYIHFLGAHAEIQDDAATIKRDLILALATSFILVLGLFVIAFRRVSALLFVGVPLLMGIIWTLGFATLFYGRITAISCAFAAVLMGLSVDFAIHIYNRFVQEARRQQDLRLSLEIALVETGKVVITSALTTAIAFYGLCLSDFQGFKELGVVAGTGILLCLISMLFVLPSLMVIRALHQKKVKGLFRWRSLVLKRITIMVSAYPRLVLLLGLIITAYFSYHASHIGFNDDLSALKQPTAEYRRILEQTKRNFELPSCQLSIIVSGATLEEALQKNDALYDELEQQKERFDLVSFESLRTLFPSKDSQQKSHLRIQRDLDMGLLDDLWRAEAAKLGLGSEAYRNLWRRLDKWRESALLGRVLDWNNIDEQDQLNSLLIEKVQNYVIEKSDAYRVVTNVYPRDPQWRKAIPPEFIQALEDRVGPVSITGSTILARELEEVLLKDLVLVVGIVAAGIFLVLLLHFRSVRVAIVAMIPLACSVIWLLGTLRLIGLQLNFMNIVIIPMVIGLGIDDGMHILQRYYEQGEQDIRAAIEWTGRAVVMSSLTTMLGFGSLILAQFPSVRQMGQMCVLGVGYALFASLLLLPALLWAAGGKINLLKVIGMDQGVSE